MNVLSKALKDAIVNDQVIHAFFLSPWFGTKNYCRALGFSVETYCRNFSLKTIPFIHLNSIFWL